MPTYVPAIPSPPEPARGRFIRDVRAILAVIVCDYSSSLRGAGPSVHAMSRSEGRHISHIRIPGTPLRVDLVLVLVLDRANFHPHAVRPSLATR